MASVLSVERRNPRVLRVAARATDGGWSMVYPGADKQDLTAQRVTLRELAVSEDRVYLDQNGFCGDATAFSMGCR